ncbi:DUF2970 domain-containing protein [Variovorax saccharolyticus]|uniref:DUF2970 domain-containing protein n=1 Tax=Variovorax saccharolyticus TaxID=3053516 RepID=UPI002576346F|nr:DUF2970 domain-containing protein [Variovorax sp. J31P216]MDM0028960.1 DUF2970 domain-containing protein [Variovorax sp. J31P216]
MSKYLRYLRAVLWGFIGLGGRRADADQRVGQAGVIPTIVIALVLALLLVAGLIALARFVAGG